jgi:nitrogen fixation protein FixH
MNTGMTLPADLARRERRAQRWWLGGIIAFFAVQALIWTAAITLTHRDHAYAVVPDYDQRAMHWDDYRAELEASKALGWQTKVSLTPVPHRSGRARIELRLTDRTGAPVLPDSFALTVFHCARAARRIEVPLAVEGETLSGEVPMDRPGLWQLELEAARGADRLVDRQREMVDGATIGLPGNRYLDRGRQP